LTKCKKHISSLLAKDQRAKFYKKTDIPPRFRCKTFEDIYTEQKKEYLKQILAGDSLFITGGSGTGKTFLAVVLAQEFYIQNIIEAQDYYSDKSEFKPSKSILFLPATELFLKLKSSFNESSGEIEILDNLDKADLLILDDIGTDKVSDWSKQIIYTIVDRRYRNMKQLIVTSNLSLQEIGKLYDDRIASRLMEMGSVVELVGKDKRIKQV